MFDSCWQNPEYGALVQELEDSTDEDITRLIMEEQTAAAAIDDNPEVIQLYERRKKEIEAKRRELNAVLDVCNNGQSKIDAKRREWEEKLQCLAQKLDVRFTTYMKQMEVEGSVKLASAGDNYKEWGLEIWVSFRKSMKKSILNANVHSGGERSVSTILFLMALQVRRMLGSTLPHGTHYGLSVLGM